MAHAMGRSELSKDEVLNKLDAFIAAAGNRKKAAADIGVSYKYLTDVVNQILPPGPKVLAALGLQLTKVYRPVAQRSDGRQSVGVRG